MLTITTAPSPDDPMDVLFYEMQMMNRAFKALSTASTDVEKNLFIEGFLLHLRNLIYFFFKEPKKEDISVSHFKDNAGNQITTACMPSALPEDEISKHLSHMTTRRSKQKVVWHCSALLVQMNQTIE